MIPFRNGDAVQIVRRNCSAPRGATWEVVGHSRGDGPERLIIARGDLRIEVPPRFLAIARPEPEVDVIPIGRGRQLTFDFEAAVEVGA